MVMTPNGVMKKNPWLGIVESRRAFLRQMLSEFGASPSSAAKTSGLMTDPEDDDPISHYM
jgi:phage terminase small subunit